MQPIIGMTWSAQQTGLLSFRGEVSSNTGLPPEQEKSQTSNLNPTHRRPRKRRTNEVQSQYGEGNKIDQSEK